MLAGRVAPTSWKLAAAISAMVIGAAFGSQVSIEAQGQLHSALLDTAAIIFGISGAALAFALPASIQRLQQSSPGEPEYERKVVESLNAAAILGVACVAALLAYALAGLILRGSPWRPPAAVLRSGSLGFLALVTVLELRALAHTLSFVHYTMSLLSFLRSAKAADADRVHRVYNEPEPSKPRARSRAKATN